MRLPGSGGLALSPNQDEQAVMAMRMAIVAQIRVAKRGVFPRVVIPRFAIALIPFSSWFSPHRWGSSRQA